MISTKRTSGILLPIFSLPTKYGIGSLGKEAYQFLDFLHEANCHIWQMLPLTVTSYGDSPYQSPSNNGLNYYLIDLDTLIEKKLLTQEECDSFDFESDPRRISYELLFKNRIPLLRKAFDRFDKNSKAFVKFEKEGTYRDFAFFMTLKVLNDFKPWYQWNKHYSHYSKKLEENIITQHHDLYLFFIWTQYEFLNQYSKLRAYAKKLKVKIMGDMPLYLAYDSVEAYKYPKLFLFDEKHQPTVVAGCPPDAFSDDGQLWGNPIYDWKRLEKDKYSFFNKRISYYLKFFDILRIDHFRGFAGYYAVPFGDETAKNGRWEKGPGIKLFKDKLNLPIVAEDLGYLDDDVRELLKESGYPGMKVLEFAFDGNENNDHLPSNYSKNCFAYTGTHDNMPLLGHLLTLSETEYQTLLTGLKKQCELFDVDYDDSSLKNIVRTITSLCFASPAISAIVPYQDVVPTGRESRINLPSTLSTSNWSYRFTADQFTQDSLDFIKELNKRYNR